MSDQPIQLQFVYSRTCPKPWNRGKNKYRQFIATSRRFPYVCPELRNTVVTSGVGSLWRLSNCVWIAGETTIGTHAQYVMRRIQNTSKGRLKTRLSAGADLHTRQYIRRTRMRVHNNTTMFVRCTSIRIFRRYTVLRDIEAIIKCRRGWKYTNIM